MGNFRVLDSYWVRIYGAGDINTCKQIVREECYREGLCVTVEPCDYIYTGGEESGYCIRLINYPRFPSSPEQILARAKDLALKVMRGCCQNKILIMDKDKTYLFP